VLAINAISGSVIFRFFITLSFQIPTLGIHDQELESALAQKR
jgi:hypothetical protein